MQRERERRFWQRERDRRRRRRKRKERMEQQRPEDRRNNGGEDNKESSETDATVDPLETSSGGQLTEDAISSDGKGQAQDVEDPREEDDDSYSSYSDDGDIYLDDDLDELPENL